MWSKSRLESNVNRVNDLIGEGHHGGELLRRRHSGSAGVPEAIRRGVRFNGGRVSIAVGRTGLSSHADKRRARRRVLLGEEFGLIGAPAGLSWKNKPRPSRCSIWLKK